MLAHTETVIEYNASCNRIHTILPEFDMEMYQICNIISAPITKLQAKLSNLLSEVNYRHTLQLLPMASVNTISNSRSRPTPTLPTNL